MSDTSCPTCGMSENTFCSNAFHVRNNPDVTVYWPTQPLTERLRGPSYWKSSDGYTEVYDSTPSEAADHIEALEATQAELVDNLDTLEKLRADLAEESPGRHAQRIAVLDIHIERQRALLAKLEQQP